jgi:hypothetical protein
LVERDEAVGVGVATDLGRSGTRRHGHLGEPVAVATTGVTTPQ